MKITEIQGDLFAGLKAGEAIAHGANCKGAMGAGVAKGIRDRFPYNYSRYKYKCLTGQFYPGDFYAVRDQGVLIYNLGTQMNLGADAQLINVISSVRSMAHHAVLHGLHKVKTVRLGCGIGGLDWNDVKPALQAIKAKNFELEVYFI